MRQVDISGYFRIECRVCQNLIEVLSAKAGLFRNFLQHSLITNRPGLLPVRLHDGLMEDCSLPLRFSILLNNERDRKSTRLNSSHTVISYAVFCLKKKKKKQE